MKFGIGISVVAALKAVASAVFDSLLLENGNDLELEDGNILELE
jgi:hypothetical protein